MKYYALGEARVSNVDAEKISKSCYMWFRKKCLTNKRSMTMKQYMLHIAHAMVERETDDGGVKLKRHTPFTKTIENFQLKSKDKFYSGNVLAPIDYGITEYVHYNDNFVSFEDGVLVVWSGCEVVRAIDDNKSDSIMAIFTAYPKEVFYEILTDNYIDYSNSNSRDVDDIPENNKVSDILRNSTVSIMVDVLTGNTYVPKLTLPGDVPINPHSDGGDSNQCILRTMCNMFGKFQATENAGYGVPCIESDAELENYVFSLTNNERLASKLTNKSKPLPSMADVVTKKKPNNTLNFNYFSNGDELQSLMSHISVHELGVDLSDEFYSEMAQLENNTGLPRGWTTEYHAVDIESVNKRILHNRTIHCEIFELFKIRSVLNDIDISSTPSDYRVENEWASYIFDIGDMVEFCNSERAKNSYMHPESAIGLNTMIKNWRIIIKGVLHIIGDREGTTEYFIGGFYEKN